MLRLREVINELRNLWLVRIADDPDDPRESSDIFRSALGVTAGNDHAGSGIHCMDLADGVASLSISGGSDRASVHDDEICGGSFGDDGATALEQLTLDGGAVRLRSAAAELLDVESCHREIQDKAYPGNMLGRKWEVLVP